MAFGGARTYHRMTVAIEDAGFEIRDMISWISNKTFPKSHNIGKAIDKAAGVQREITGWKSQPFKISNGPSAAEHNQIQGSNAMDSDGYRTAPITEPSTDEAKQWEGWGTGLKPTVEPIVMARKPVVGTIAENVLKFGTGAINIKGSRIGTEQRTNNRNDFSNQHGNQFGNGKKIEKLGESEVTGRWPANVILDEDSAQILDEQTSHLHAAGNKMDTGQGLGQRYESSSYQISYSGIANRTHNDSGGASRFFYVAKASKSDRNEGLEDSNNHPTVKPTNLMRYLVKLVTPPGGTVLDPFTGSGSTGKAAILEGFEFVGIELTEDYLPIIQGRLNHAEQQLIAMASAEDEKLF